MPDESRGRSVLVPVVGSAVCSGRALFGLLRVPRARVRDGGRCASPARVSIDVASERALANPYVRAFVDEKPLLERFLHDPAMAHWARKANLRKEITEAMGALTQIRRCVPTERDGDGDASGDGCVPRDSGEERERDGNGEGLVFVDLCAGRGMLSILMAHFFPAARVLMVDADPKIKLPHLACLPTVEHHLLDVQSAEAFDLVRGAVRDATRACIVVGVHLCGDLSRRAVQLFLETNARALVL